MLSVKKSVKNTSKHAQPRAYICFRIEINNRTTKNGGGERDRTDDPLLAKQVLSQLSYTPNSPRVALKRTARKVSGGSGWVRTIDPRLIKTVL